MDKVDENSTFDTRTLKRNLAAGRVSQEAVDRHLAELEDCAEEADWTTTQMAQPVAPEGGDSAAD